MADVQQQQDPVQPIPQFQRAAFKKNQSSKTMDFINTGLGPQVVHDVDNQAHIVQPGGQLKIEMHAGVAEKLERASDRGAPLQTGARAKHYLDRQKFEQEMRDKEARMKQEFEADTRKGDEELRTRQTKADKGKGNDRFGTETDRDEETTKEPPKQK